MASSDKELVGLRSKREAAGLTQRELADRLSALDPEGSWDQSKVSRYEMNEEAVPAGALMRMLRILGESAFVVERPELRGVDLGAPYSDLFSSIADRVTAPAGCSAGWSQPLEEAARTATRKPLVGVLGSYDSGKSTIINSLLGSASMPTSYQPQTFLVTYIHHLADRPATSEDEVFLMTDSFNPSAWRSGDTFQDNEVLKSGSLALLVRTDDAEFTASTAMVFLDAPVLRACSLVDSPGSLECYGHEQEDIATVKITMLDAAIVCSPVNGFMNSDSLAHTLDALHLLSPHAGPILDRLLIVVTHAHARVSDAVLEMEIMGSGAQRISYVLKAHAGDTGGAASAEELHDRIIAFDPEHHSRVERFLAEIQRWLGEGGSLAHEHRIQTVDALQRERAALSAALDEYLAKLRGAIKADPNDLSVLTQEEFNEQVDSSANKLLDKVRQHRAASISAALVTGASYDPAKILGLIESYYSGRKKDAREGASLYVLSLINREIEKDLRARTKQIQAALDDWMGGLETTIPKFSTSSGESTFSFRARIFGAFAGAGVGAAGATAAGAYAATLGNLGAYILVAKGVSALSALGISVGGVAPAVSFIAAIGGPVTLGVAAISVLALTGFTIVGGNWQKTLAKQIHKKLVKELLFPDPGKANKGPSIPDALSTYWRGLESDIARAATEAKAAYADLLADKPDVVDLPGHISELETTRAWLDGVTFQDLIAQ